MLVFGRLYLGPVATIAGLGIATHLLRRDGRRWHDLGLRRPASWFKTILGAIGLYFLFGLTAAVILAPLSYGFDLDRPDIEAFLVIRGNLPLYLLFLALAWSVAAFGEELLLRGFILNRIADGLGRTRAAWATATIAQALLFGAGHWDQGLSGVIGITVVGVVLGFGYLKAGRNLWVVILCHGIVDTVSMTAIYFGVVPRA